MESTLSVSLRIRRGKKKRSDCSMFLRIGRLRPVLCPYPELGRGIGLCINSSHNIANPDSIVPSL